MYKRQLRERVLGRVTGEDLVDPETQETVIFTGTMLDEDLVDLIDKLGIDEVRVRTPLTCETRYGPVSYTHLDVYKRQGLDDP